jgi:hypothetical protein
MATPSLADNDGKRFPIEPRPAIAAVDQNMGERGAEESLPIANLFRELTPPNPCRGLPLDPSALIDRVAAAGSFRLVLGAIGVGPAAAAKIGIFKLCR